MMKFLKRKKGKKYPEMVDTIHGDSMEDVLVNENGEMPDGEQEEDPGNEETLNPAYASEGPEEETDSGESASDDKEDRVQKPEKSREFPEIQGTDEEDWLDQEIPEEEKDLNPDSDEEVSYLEDTDGSDQETSYEKNSWESSEQDGMLSGQENQPADSFPPYEEQDGTDEDFMSERDIARQARMKRRKREMRRIRFLICLLVLLLFAGCGTAGYLILSSRGIEISFASLEGFLSGKSKEKTDTIKEDAGQNTDDEKNLSGNAKNGETSAQSEEKKTEKVTEDPSVTIAAEVTAKADLMAAQYDYDGAINLLKTQQGYETDTAAQQKVSGYETAKAACVEISPDTVSHVFVHSLIVDPSRAFDGQDNQQGYNLNMVTLEEFKKIIQSMYDNGYVLVSLHDMGEIDANGKMQRKSIYLPEGKKPIIFSQDDVSYYHSYANDGFADRLIVDENGDVKNEYTDAAGNTTVGDYDMVPVLDTFIKEHPDFSYRGRKGIVVLTGYNGVLGYHTDGDYRDKLSLQEDQAKWLDEHPEFDFDADVAAATKVADAMKANGWEFASHTWGHISVSDVSLERLQVDTQKWLDYVSPIVGGTDMIIFAFGSDIGDWTGYSADNEKFNYLKSVGFNYFCNVDGSSLSWVQFGETYLRTGRMNIDGYRMSSNPDILAPLFDVSQVYDYNNRPEMAEWSQ